MPSQPSFSPDQSRFMARAPKIWPRRYPLQPPAGAVCFRYRNGQGEPAKQQNDGCADQSAQASRTMCCLPGSQYPGRGSLEKAVRGESIYGGHAMPDWRVTVNRGDSMDPAVWSRYIGPAAGCDRRGSCGRCPAICGGACRRADQHAIWHCLTASADGAICFLEFVANNDQPAMTRLTTIWPGVRLVPATGPELALGFHAGRSRAKSLPACICAARASSSRVWNELLAIPAGNRVSYGELAAQNRPAARSACGGGCGGRKPPGFARTLPSGRACGR
jgi:O6-methylguanine-DNA--protein-cysteine methyltransferase